MRLTHFTDYSIRVLIYLGVHHDRYVSIGEISDAYGISRNHLLKVAHHLSKSGFVEGVRGRGGGLRLAMSPDTINLGEVVRSTETDFDMVECFSESENTCPISPSCRLKKILSDATKAFLSELDQYNLAELIRNRSSLIRLLG